MSRSPLDRLRAALPPCPTSAGAAAADRDAVPAAEAALAVTLPSDYKEFLAVYGAGTINDFLTVAGPAEESDLVGITATFRRAAAKPRNAGPLGAPGEAFVRWGVDDGGRSYLWRTDGADSDGWPVCLYAEGELTVYPFGFVEFLARLCEDSLPAGSEQVLGPGPRVFVHWREARRREAEAWERGD